MNIATAFKGNKRLKGESFEQFKGRRLTENLLLKWYLKGKIIWQGRSVWKTNITDGKSTLVRQGQGPISSLDYDVSPDINKK